MKRVAICCGLSVFCCVLLSLVPYAPAHAATTCTAAGSGTVNWSTAFAGCGVFTDKVIPVGLTVIQDTDISLGANLTVNGALDGVSQQKKVTITGGNHVVLTGSTLAFYDLDVIKSPIDTSAEVVGDLAVTNNFALEAGGFTGLTRAKNVSISSSSALTLTHDLEVQGNFSNSGVFDAQTGTTVYFNGTGEQWLSLQVPTNFATLKVGPNAILYDYTATNRAHVTTLINNGVIRGTAYFFSTPSQLDLGLAGKFAGDDLKVTITQRGTTYMVQVDRTDARHPNAPDGASNEVYWKFTANAPGYKADLLLPYHNATAPKACTYVSGSWNCGASSTTASLVGRTGMADLSDWVVFDGATSVSVTADPNPIFVTKPVTFTATVSGTTSGNVQFFVDNVAAGSPQPLTSGRAEYTTSSLAAGTHTVKASYLGYLFWTQSEATLSGGLLVKEIARAKVDVTSSANPASYGQNVTLEANLTAIAPATGTPTGTITFQDEGSAIAGCSSLDLSNGRATCPVSTFGVGSHEITVNYDGNATFFPGSGTLAPDQVVSPADTATTLASAPRPSVYGQTVLITATVNAVAPSAATPTGTITITVDDVDEHIMTLDENGAAAFDTSSLSAGNHKVAAAYAGTDNFATSNTTLENGHTVDLANTALELTSSPRPSVFGETVTISASVQAVAPGIGQPGGTINFEVDNSDQYTATVDGSGVAAIETSSLSVLTHTVTAVYSGDANFAESGGSLTDGHRVNPADTAVAVVSSNPSSVYGQVVTFTATLSAVAPGVGTPSGLVTFNAGGSSIADCIEVKVTDAKAECSVGTLAVGEYEITGDYLGDTSFKPNTGNLTGGQVVTKANTEVAVTSSVSPTVYGQSVTFTATVAALAPGAGSPTGAMTFQSDSVTISGCAAVSVTAGEAVCTVHTLLPNGDPHNITATYSGDSSFETGEGQLSGGHQVNRNNATVSVAGDRNPSVYGETVYITATVAAQPPQDTLGGTANGSLVLEPTGFVTFTIDAVEVLPPALIDSDGLATYQVSSLAVGSHSVGAVYAGDANYIGDSATPITHQVDKAASQVEVASSANPSVFGQEVTLTATITATAPGAGIPTGVVTFTLDSQEAGTATLDGNGEANYTTSTLALGNHAVRIDYAGDANFATSSGTLAEGQQVDKPDTAATIEAFPNPSVFGQSVTFTGTVAAVPPGTGTPTGQITFKAADTDIGACFELPLVDGQVTCSISSLSVMTHAIAVSYLGDLTFNAGNGSLKGGHVVNRAATVVSIETTPTPSAYGQNITITATMAVTGAGAGTPTGNVVFKSDSVTLGNCASLQLSNGQVTCKVNTLPVGNHEISAEYQGDEHFEPSTGVATSSQIVSQAAPVVTITSEPNPSSYRQTVLLTATVSAPLLDRPSVSTVGPDGPTGSVTITLGNDSEVFVLTDGVATVSTSALAVGNYAARAEYSGDTNYTVAASDPYTHTVTKAATTTALVIAPNPGLKDETVVLTATVSAQPVGVTAFDTSSITGTVTFTDATGTVNLNAELNAGQAVVNTSLLPAGTYTVVSSYGGNEPYLGSIAEPVVLVVKKYPSATAIKSSDNPVYVDGGLSFTVEVGDLEMQGVGLRGGVFPTGTVAVVDTTGTISLTGSLDNGVADLSAPVLEEGTYTITANYTGSERYEPSTSTSLAQVVVRRATATEVKLSPNPALVGDRLIITATVGSISQQALNNSGPNGNVQFFANGGPVGTAEITGGRGVYDTRLPMSGTFVITATYGGNQVYGPSTAPQMSLTVNKRYSSVALTAAPNPARFGTIVTFTATVTQTAPDVQADTVSYGPPLPKGEVIFWEGALEVGRSKLQKDGSAVLTLDRLAAGEHEIMATFAGDVAYFESQSAGYVQVIQPLPLAVNDAAGTLEDQPVAIAVLANDKDQAGGGLLVSSVTQPLSGVVVIDPAGASRGGVTVTYTPNPGFSGLDGFTYVARDGNGNEDDAYVAVVVAAHEQNGNASEVVPIDPKEESHTIFTDTHTSVALHAPADIYSGTLGNKDVFYVAYTPVISPTGDVSQQPGGMKFSNYVFHLDAYLNGNHLDNFHFAKPITLTISYDPLLIGNLEEELLTLYYWNGTTWSSDGITVLSRDFTNHSITVQISHLSEFSFFSAAAYHLALPQVLNLSGPTRDQGPAPLSGDPPTYEP